MTKEYEEKWPSGLRRHPAKVLYGAICTVGSNPTFSELNPIGNNAIGFNCIKGEDYNPPIVGVF